MASNRQYLTKDELEEFANIDVVNETEADDQISQAEELIDAFVGFQDPAFCDDVKGKATGGTANTVTLQEKHKEVYENDYFTYCWIEIIGGTGVGQRRQISGSTKAGVITTSSDFTTPPDTSSVYRIYQLGKFPRCTEAFYNSEETPSKWYKWIPEEVRRATAAQVQFIIEMGDEYFASDVNDKLSERLDDYSYTKDKVTLLKFIAPKARQLLRGIVNRVGQFV